MVVLIRDTRNKFFYTLAFNTSNSNMASVLNVDIVDDSVVNNIIFNNSDNNDEMRGYTLTPSANSSRSISSFSPNKSKELYSDWI